MSENESNKVPLEEWPLEILEARLTNLENQIVMSSEENINQATLSEMAKLQSNLIKIIARKKSENK